MKHFSSAITLRSRESIMSWIITEVIEEIKVMIDLEKTQLKKFDKKIEAEIKLTRNANLIARIRLIRVWFNDKSRWLLFTV